MEPPAQHLPHEPEGSGGLAGMAMSAICAPVYLASLAAALLRIRGGFVVTPKGGDASPDRLPTFRIHLGWAAVLALSLAASVRLGHTQAAMRTWAVLALLIALAPVAVWAWTLLRERRAGATARARAAGSPALGLGHGHGHGHGPGEEPEPVFAAPTGGN